MSLADAIRVLNQKVPPVHLPENPREPLQASNHEGFSEVRSVPSEKSNIQSKGDELPGGDQSGNGLVAANGERITVHVPEFTLGTGKRVSFDLDVPKAKLPSLRQSLRFELKDEQGGGSILGLPGQSDDEVRAVLIKKYEGRLATINGAEVAHG